MVVVLETFAPAGEPDPATVLLALEEGLNVADAEFCCVDTALMLIDADSCWVPIVGEIEKDVVTVKEPNVGAVDRVPLADERKPVPLARAGLAVPENVAEPGADEPAAEPAEGEGTAVPTLGVEDEVLAVNVRDTVAEANVNEGVLDWEPCEGVMESDPGF
jgi:hypothetical protein